MGAGPATAPVGPLAPAIQAPAAEGLATSPLDPGGRPPASPPPLPELPPPGPLDEATVSTGVIWPTGGTLALQDGTLGLSVAAGAADGWFVVVHYTPSEAEVVPPELPDGYALVRPATRLATVDAAGLPVSFQAPAALAVQYADEELAARGLDETRLVLLLRDAASGTWQQAAATPDVARNRLVVSVASLDGDLALAAPPLAQPAEALDAPAALPADAPAPEPALATPQDLQDAPEP